MTINPLYILAAATVIVLGIIGGVIGCAALGDKDLIPTIIGIGTPIVLLLLGAIGVSAHQTNVVNQAKIEDKTDQAALKADDAAHAAAVGVQQNDKIIKQVATVQQTVDKK